MLKEDFVIQSTIRRTLIRNNVDYTEITFGTVRGVVYFRGRFKLAQLYTDGTKENALEFTTRSLHSLERKIKSIPGVSDVVFEFFNWEKEKGKWVPKDLKEDRSK